MVTFRQVSPRKTFRCVALFCSEQALSKTDPIQILAVDVFAQDTVGAVAFVDDENTA